MTDDRPQQDRHHPPHQSADTGPLALAVHRHLVAICGRCADEWQRLSNILRDAYRRVLRDLAAPEDPVPPHREDLPVEASALEPLHRHLKALRKEQRRAKQQLSELRHTPRHLRAGKIRGAHSRFRSRMLAELLIDEARGRVRNEPAEAESFLSLVPRVLAWTRGEAEPAWATILLARAAAHRANALRVRGELPAADEVFGELHRALEQRPLGDPNALGEITSLEASLRTAQRKLEEADELLAQAVVFFRYGGHAAGLTTAAILKANVAYTRGLPDMTLEILEVAEAEGEAPDDPYLAVCHATAKVNALCDVGRPAEARRFLDRSRDIFADDEAPHTAVLLRILEGRIARGLGEYATAEATLRDVTEALWQLDRSYDAALAALDLAEVLLAQGRTREPMRVAAHLVREFGRRKVEPEAREAVALFRDAALAGELTDAVLAATRRRLHQAQGRISAAT